MPMWFTDGAGRALPPELLRPGESDDVRPVTKQRDEAEYLALVEHLHLTGQGERALHDWLLDPAAVTAALAAARRGGIRQLRRCGVR